MKWKDLVVGILVGKSGRPRCFILFTYGVFKDAVDSSTFIESNDRIKKLITGMEGIFRDVNQGTIPACAWTF